jgi:hypothetical protein
MLAPSNMPRSPGAIARLELRREHEGRAPETVRRRRRLMKIKRRSQECEIMDAQADADMSKPRRKRRAKRPSQAIPPGPEERPHEPEENGSVQDPLQDWADDDADRWLRERAGDDVEKPQDPPDRQSPRR